MTGANEAKREWRREDLEAALEWMEARAAAFGPDGLAPARDVLRRHIAALDDPPATDPTAAEIVAHLRAGGTVERWSAHYEWQHLASFLGDASWWAALSDQDRPNPGYRLMPLPPVTEWVPLAHVVGRTLPGAEHPVDGFRCGAYRGLVWWPKDGFPTPRLTVDSDGMVEVLVGGEAS